MMVGARTHIDRLVTINIYFLIIFRLVYRGTRNPLARNPVAI